MIYVICVNDSPEEATKDKALAEKRMRELELQDFQKTKGYGGIQSFENYCKKSYWHIHKVREVKEHELESRSQDSRR